MVIRMRHTRAHTKNRRSHHALKSSTFSSCLNCKAPTLNHRVCNACGFYKNKKVVDKARKLLKKDKDKKSKT